MVRINGRTGILSAMGLTSALIGVALVVDYNQGQELRQTATDLVDADDNGRISETEYASKVHDVICRSKYIPGHDLKALERAEIDEIISTYQKAE